MDNKYDVVIIGSGVSGLAAYKRCKELNYSAAVFESDTRPGGLLDSFTIEDFTFDNAVHLSFATEEIVRAVFDKVPHYKHPSDSYCHDNGYWLKHPVQNNLFPLPVNEKVNLIESFFEKPNSFDEQDYESWLKCQYGELFANKYPIRYTKKYWDIQPSELSTTWIENRMRKSNASEILRGAMTPETPNTYYVSEMRYPKHGGFRSFINELVEDSNVLLNHNLEFIDTKNSCCIFTNGNTVYYNKLVSTIPLPEIINKLTDVPSEISYAANRLLATSIDLISVGFNRQLIDKLWFYIYDEDIYASRAYSPSVKSINNAPKGCSSLQFEVYSLGCEPKYTSDELKANVLYALRKLNIAQGSDLLFIHHKRLRYGNVVYYKNMELDRALVLDFIKSRGLRSCGRFGDWAYLWSNQSFMSGYRCVDW